MIVKCLFNIRKLAKVSDLNMELVMVIKERYGLIRHKYYLLDNIYYFLLDMFFT